ncbi:hypothetical protein PHPALM_29496 [Phytophthora palmivora]|uniref:Carbohydrate esterase n=1 Tax=Phytophthora palmivora TaxID=4796 RepID=A0A2P4X7F4_9STRA|nr:hypothetical protein PHPALM_29496 [Phytophthora palmivora]
MHLNGYNNTKTVLEWALNNFPDPEKLVIGGHSAGSLGAQLWSAKIAEMWHVEQKSITYQVLADSYIGEFPEQKAAASSLLNFFGGCDVDLHFPELMQVECKAETATATALVDALIQETPKSKWLFIDSNADRMQRDFYELARNDNNDERGDQIGGKSHQRGICVLKEHVEHIGRTDMYDLRNMALLECRTK